MNKGSQQNMESGVSVEQKGQESQRNKEPQQNKESGVSDE